MDRQTRWMLLRSVENYKKLSGLLLTYPFNHSVINAVILGGWSGSSWSVLVWFENLRTHLQRERERLRGWRERERDCKCQMLMRLEKAEEKLKRGGEAAERGGKRFPLMYPNYHIWALMILSGWRKRETKERSRERRGRGRKRHKERHEWPSRRASVRHYSSHLRRMRVDIFVWNSSDFSPETPSCIRPETWMAANEARVKSLVNCT